MSVTYRPDKPNETAELKKEVETVKAAGWKTIDGKRYYFGLTGGRKHRRPSFPFIQSADCRRPRRGNECDHR
jgi:hypothetical protein